MSDELPTLKRDGRKQARKDSVAAIDKKTEDVSFVQLEAPMSATAVGFVRKRYEVRLSGQQALAIRRLTLGLGESGAKLQNGKFIETGSDAIKWLLENL